MTRIGRRRAERGGVAVIVGVLLAGGVLLGAGAIAIDVGNMMFERRQLQNASDATAMRLASACAKDLTACDDDQRAAALATLASANAQDGVAQLDRRVYPDGQCGRVPGAPDLPACNGTGDTADLGQCPALPTDLVTNTAIPYVETYTLTKTTAGASKLASFFGIGDGTTVGACARAAWGTPKGASVLPLTFSYCEWEDAIADRGYGNDPIVSSDKFAGETALAFKYQTGGKPGDPCPALGHSGMDAPGGFGWLDQTDCKVNVTAGGWVVVDTGKSGPSTCINPGDKVYIPIFNCVSKLKVLCDNVAGGANTNYHIDGFAAFYITSIINASDNRSLAGYPGTTARNECKAEATDNKSCIYGWFLDDYVDYTAGGILPPGTGTDYGVTKVIPAG